MPPREVGEIRLEREPITAGGGEAKPVMFDPAFYDCPRCNNTGAILIRDAAGRLKGRVCPCVERRKAKRQAEQYRALEEASGMVNAIRGHTFDSWQAREPWQGQALKLAREFAANPAGWFYIGGASGCGKTHLCSAICAQIIAAGIPAVYLPWREVASRAKSTLTDTAAHDALVQPLKEVRCLFVDDFLKAARDRYGTMTPTPGDVNFAYDLINARYLDPATITIITSEMHLPELADVDHAVMRRIRERAGRYFLDVPAGAKDYMMAYGGQA